MIAWVPAAVGFVAGGVFQWVADQAIPHIHPGIQGAVPEGPATNWHRTTLLVTTIALYNIPEGLAVGVALGAAAMIYVVIEELIPESHAHSNEDLATMASLFGFLVMMTLNVALG